DWRLPLDKLADALAPFLRNTLDHTRLAQRPIRILAHSMGGLVVRALIHQYPALWDELMARDGARFVMLGTPNQGAHSMVETLIGAGDTIRQLARADVRHNLQEILDIVAGFRGALQLLPRPGFQDLGGAQFDDYFTESPWTTFKAEMKDFWFGDQVAAIPDGAALQQGKWLWAPASGSTAGLPGAHKDKTIYVYGCAPNTACGIKKDGARWKMLGTAKGDGTVTWASGWIDGIGRGYFMPAIHGDLASTAGYFSALNELLVNGMTSALTTSEPQTRGAKEQIIAYTPNPPTYGTAAELAHALMGAPKRQRSRSRARPTLSVTVRAMDLRFVSQPILVGHYEQDAIAGAEALIDSEVVNQALSERYNLGLYAGAVGTAVVVLRLPNAAEKLRGSCSGAVVTGLGPYDGTLAANMSTEAVRTGALRYLLQYADCSGERSGEISLCTLLLGYNSTANLTIAASVEALVRGVVDSNKKFAEATRGSLRIRSLEIIELYRDTAISAMRALQSFAVKNNVEASDLGVFLDVPEELQEGRGARQRLDDSRSAAYYPRLIITDADRDQDDCGPESTAMGERGVLPHQAADSRGPTTAIAARLRFVHVGQRARAETVVQQRQPGLVENLIAQQILVKAYRPDFCRTLFQLMVPHEFKEAARQLDRIVLVVDGYTANLPWELMLADQEPLAVTARVIRQLASSQFRRQVRQTLASLAYVIGNPSTDNFFATFPVPGAQPSDALEPLDGAEREAEIVGETLRRHGYAVEQAIGPERKALEVMNALYQKSYRIVHIAAHGMFEQRAVDGSARSGVVLSDGLLLGAAEIGQMEIVPDLVFLNCCHLAKINARPVAYNRLAYSVARELIEIGVRCVVAAGWAVDDDAAYTFAETFYQNILQDNLQFGDAVFAARRETYRKHGGSITWGAYQAYGDPGWRIKPGGAASSLATSARKFVAPEELLDGIAAVRMKISRHRDALSKPYARNLAAELQQLIERSPKSWAEKPAVKFALAAAYAELGADYFEHACELYSAAVLAEDRAGQVPIAAIEQLANLEARLGEHKSLPALIDRAVERLRDLDKAVTATVDYASGEKSAVPRSATNPERAAVLGSVYKRKAAIFARKIVAGDRAAATRREFGAAVNASIAAYQTAAGEFASGNFEPYPALNWLALKSLSGRFTAGVDTCRQCAKIANEKFARTPDFWCAVMAPEAALIESLCDGSLGGAAAELRLDQIARGYSDALATIQVAPKELDSMVQQLLLLALLFEAGKKVGMAQPLRRLAERLLPGSSAVDETSGPAKLADKPAPNARRRKTRRKP
ncbi:MAG TPA: CHAT domain-containing protein, partial [Candidatus Saccharimonadales bacterium]|nr:CHAT domain-containing protein [Candidatus Saccharimonadales bacterium]